MPGVTGAEEPCHCSRCSAGRVPGGNTLFYGFENKNLGDGADLGPEEQLDAMALARRRLPAHCWRANRVIAHKEWTRNKPVDPRFDMNDFRARVAQFSLTLRH